MQPDVGKVVGWVEKQNPTLINWMLGFVPQPNLQNKNYIYQKIYVNLRQSAYICGQKSPT
ncbi:MULTISPECIES: hypothetical protein [unclassified Microcoleus]|uniref:hypothetical protein n=1 Tax=unclassified Microcoleus TaxID=2642155 RepID=UPI002FD6757A